MIYGPYPTTKWIVAHGTLEPVWHEVEVGTVFGSGQENVEVFDEPQPARQKMLELVPGFKFEVEDDDDGSISP